MQKLYLIQCLCPNRHGILALSMMFDISDEETRAQMRREFEHEIDELIAGRGSPELRAASLAFAVPGSKLNSICGICGAQRDTWKVTIEPTGFKSLEEAMPALKQNEKEQRLSRMAIDLMRHREGQAKAAKN